MLLSVCSTLRLNALFLFTLEAVSHFITMAIVWMHIQKKSVYESRTKYRKTNMSSDLHSNNSIVLTAIRVYLVFYLLNQSMSRIHSFSWFSNKELLISSYSIRHQSVLRIVNSNVFFFFTFRYAYFAHVMLKSFYSQ